MYTNVHTSMANNKGNRVPSRGVWSRVFHIFKYNGSKMFGSEVQADFTPHVKAGTDFARSLIPPAVTTGQI